MTGMRLDEFFPLSPELTEQLIRRMNEKYIDRLAPLRGSASPAQEGSEGRGGAGGMLEAVLSALGRTSPRSEPEIQRDQRWLREILYHYLARLANSPRAREGETFSVTECIRLGMRSRLGLKHETDVPLLDDLASEFRKWLSGLEGRTFVAGWGEIIRSQENPDLFTLSKFEEPPVSAPVAAEGSTKAGKAVAVGQSLNGGSHAGHLKRRSAGSNKRRGVRVRVPASSRSGQR